MLQPQTHPLSAGGIHPSRQRADRRRLAKVVDLARIYRNCGVKELADLVRRDKTRLVPETGNPKIDLVASLAEVLDWSIQDVVEAIRGERLVQRAAVLHGYRSFSELAEMARRAHAGGHWRALQAIAAKLKAAARDSEQRATTCVWQGSACESTGRYQEALEHFQKGLNQRATNRETRILLRTNLANAHCLMENLLEARSVATDAIREVEADASDSSQLFNRSAIAFARYVRGSARRRQLAEGGAPKHVDQAIEDLTQARNSYHQLCRYGDSRSFQGLASTCEGALVELETLAGRLDPEAALRQIQNHLELMEHPLHTGLNVGDTLESHAWWATFGANIAWRLRAGTHQREHTTAFAERLLAIGDRLNHAGFQATGFSFLYRVHRAALDADLHPDPWSITPERLSRLVRVMGCLPGFQTTGWKILEETGALTHATTTDPRTWRKGLQGA